MFAHIRLVQRSLNRRSSFFREALQHAVLAACRAAPCHYDQDLFIAHAYRRSCGLLLARGPTRFNAAGHRL